MKKLVIASLIATVAIAKPTQAQDGAAIYLCRTLDVFIVENGTVIRHHNSSYFMNLMSQIIVDTASGLVRISGTLPGMQSGEPRMWRIERRGTTANDFVASQGPSDRIHIRPWKSPVQFMLLSNGFTVFTGT